MPAVKVERTMGEYFDLSVASFLLTIVRAVVALGLLWTLLRFFDRAVSFRFGSWLESVSGVDEDGKQVSEGNPTAVALYLGARFVGACLLFGLLFS